MMDHHPKKYVVLEDEEDSMEKGEKKKGKTKQANR